MFRNYWKVALRNLLKHRYYSVVSVIGLSVGLACCLILTLYIVDELTFDRQHPDAERIYRVARAFVRGDEEVMITSNTPQVAALLVAGFPEIEASARIIQENSVVRHDETVLYEENIHYADPALFNFFAFDWQAGQPETALLEPFSVVITESFAQRYFGTEDPLGQTLTIEGDRPLRVTGLIADLSHTHLEGDAFASMNTLVTLRGPEYFEDWNNNYFSTYIKLREGTDIALLEDPIHNYLRDRLPAAQRDWWHFYNQKLTDIHLNTTEQGGAYSAAGALPGRLVNILILSAIASGLLLIATCNFLNLSIATYSLRMEEIMVRKVLGSSRKQIFHQFWTESSLIIFLAFLFAIVIVESSLPWFNAVTGHAISLAMLGSYGAILLTAAVFLVLMVLAGLYPALYLSALKPASVNHAALHESMSPFSLRNILVVLQFAIAIVLVIATFVVFAQVRFGQTLDPGFNKDSILALQRPNRVPLGESWQTLKSSLEQHPGIEQASTSGFLPLRRILSGTTIRYEGGNPEGQSLSFYRVDETFFQAYQVAPLAGRLFSEDFSGDRVISPGPENPITSASFILNKAAVEQFGWPLDGAVGKWLEMDVSPAGDFSMATRGSIVGVVDNLYVDSIRTEVPPAVYFIPQFPGAAHSYLSLRLSEENLPATLAYIDEVWQRFFPGEVLIRGFLDDDFQSLYEKENKIGIFLGLFSAVTIVVACLGLFGLAAFTVQRRTKEIGVRKVMGGSVWSIVMLLTNDFSKLVLLSNLIAWPVAYIAMNRWLENFAYRIDLTPLIFIGSGLIALCIAWVTVGSTAAKAASQKPVLALRYE